MKIDWNRKHTTLAVYAFLVLSAVCCIVFVLFHLAGILQAANKFIQVIHPVLWGFALAYLLNRPVQFCKKKVFRFLATPKKPRRQWIKGLSIAAVYLFFGCCLLGLLAVLLPQLVRSLSIFLANLPTYLSSLDQWLQQTSERLHIAHWIDGGFSLANLFEKAFAYLKDILPDIANAGIDIAYRVVGWGSSAVLAIVISIYTLLSKDLLIAQAKKVVYALFRPKYADSTIALTRESNEIFGAYISNLLFEAFLIGLLHFLVLSICRVPYTLLISVIIALTDILPYIGPVIGAAISMLLLFVVSPAYAVTLLIVTICIQQFEANFLAPKILGESTGLTKFWVVVAILLGGGLFGLPGTILGIPLFAVLYSVLRQFIYARLRHRNLSIHSEDYRSDIDE